MRKSANRFFYIVFVFYFLFLPHYSFPQSSNKIIDDVLAGIKKATQFFDEKISVNGGYVWTYSTDLKRRWGEMEAFPSMVWIQGPGTVEMGNTFLDMYQTTNDEYYYKLAEKSTNALIKGQLPCGGWHYFINFDDEASTKKWYDTIGKNGWRLEEFQHYYGNATYDDNSTAGAAQFLLRFYLIKKDQQVYTALKKAIDLILKSQYPVGGWPQRYPPKDKFEKGGHPDYTSFLTFNDGVTWNNTCFLISCYSLLGWQKFVNPIKRAINFFVLSRQKKPQAGWAMQYSLDLKPAGARTYEPPALNPQYSARNVEALLKFYEITGDKKLLKRIPEAIEWIESVKISGEDNSLTIPTFVEIGTNKPLYIHRTGCNVKFGKYYYDYDRFNLVSHYGSTRILNLARVKKEYDRVKNLLVKNKSYTHFTFMDSLKKKSASEKYDWLQKYLQLEDFQGFRSFKINSEFVSRILSQLDEQGRWLTTDVFISNPYIGEPSEGDTNSRDYITTRVGDKYDTSPYQNTSSEKYISTSAYIRSVQLLKEFINQQKISEVIN